MKIHIQFFIVSVLLIFLPSLAFASNTHHYVCGDVTTNSYVSCTGNAWHFTSGGIGDLGYVPGLSFDVSSLGSSNLYISYTVAGTAGSFSIVQFTDGVSSACCTIGDLSVSQTSTNFNDTYGGTGNGLFIENQHSDLTLSDLCITDTPGACEAAPPPPPPTGLPGELSAAETGIATTTGLDMGAVTAFTGNTLIATFIGSGLAVLFYLRFWIVALVIISLVLIFARRAFGFFRH